MLLHDDDDDGGGDDNILVVIEVFALCLIFCNHGTCCISSHLNDYIHTRCQKE
jgi:hypothetical protein